MRIMRIHAEEKRGTLLVLYWRFSLLIAICIAGCTHNATNMGKGVSPTGAPSIFKPQIVYPGTAAYDKRIESFKLTPNVAREVAGSHFVGSDGPACVIDEWYLFSRPCKYKRIDLEGVYVNGMTGDVQRRESVLSLLGDHSVIGILKSFPSDMPKSISEARVYK